MRNRDLPEPAVGQRWAQRDDRYDGYRYMTVTAVAEDRVYAQRRDSRRPYTSFRRDRFARGSKWIFCGYDGAGVLPALSTEPAVRLGCVHAHNPTVLPMDWPLDPGFGRVLVTRNGKVEFQAMETDLLLKHIEQRAAAAPSDDWRLTIEGAMSEKLYQRQDTGWVLVAKGMGFA